MNQNEGNWWSRNWKWCVPAGCFSIVLVMVVFVGLIVALVFGLIKSSDVYKDALTQAQANESVSEALGSPIEAGFLVTGSINISGSSGDADIAIPISGPKGSGTIYAVATKSGGAWTFSTLNVQIKGSEERMNLLDDR